MNGARFDSIAKLFAERKLSRRQALQRGATGLAVGALATSIGPVRAQDATPPASDDSGPATLFVQSFEGGSIAPKADEAGRFTLSLSHGLGQTLYFTDRPDRIVGTAPTEQFLANLGFEPENPPNAAVVIDEGDGTVNIAVVELTNPVFDAVGPSVTYDIAPLADYETTVDRGFQIVPTDLSAVPASFGATHLFIDDCPQLEILCQANGQVVASMGPHASCWSATNFKCIPCYPGGDDLNSLRDYWTDACNFTYPACNSACTAVGTSLN